MICANYETFGPKQLLTRLYINCFYWILQLVTREEGTHFSKLFESDENIIVNCSHTYSKLKRGSFHKP